MTAKKKPAAIAVAKRRSTRDINEVLTFSTGVEVKLVPVSISIITEAQAAIEDPKIPLWYNESKDIHEENPNHPDYIKALEKVDETRNLAAIDAMILFGVELIEGMPENDRWLKMLQLSTKRGLLKIDFDTFDLTDSLELEYLYKKYIAVGPPDIAVIMKASGVDEEEIAEASRSFRDNS